jgi:hypothetical protein
LGGRRGRRASNLIGRYLQGEGEDGTPKRISGKDTKTCLRDCDLHLTKDTIWKETIDKALWSLKSWGGREGQRVGSFCERCSQEEKLSSCNSESKLWQYAFHHLRPRLAGCFDIHIFWLAINDPQTNDDPFESSGGSLCVRFVLYRIYCSTDFSGLF